MATPERPRAFLVAEGGVPYRVQPTDPIAAWIELMEVTEALVPAPLPSPPLQLRDARL